MCHSVIVFLIFVFAFCDSPYFFILLQEKDSISSPLCGSHRTSFGESPVLLLKTQLFIICPQEKDLCYFTNTMVHSALVFLILLIRSVTLNFLSYYYKKWSGFILHCAVRIGLLLGNLRYSF